MTVLENTLEILSVPQMYDAERFAMEAGICGIELMDAAGKRIAEVVKHKWPRFPISVLCGPGNNGGDGFVAARYLQTAGYTVRVYSLAPVKDLRGDARHHAHLWQTLHGGKTSSIDSYQPRENELIVDAIFGAGLTRPISKSLASVFKVIEKTKAAVLAVDLPSGVNGDSGTILGHTLAADTTVTFFRRKPGHVLYPGAENCGDVIVTDIGIPEQALGCIDQQILLNDLVLWRDKVPVPRHDGHKYHRGHAVILGGESMTGAARLAARAARRSGAGLSSIVTTSRAHSIYATGDPGTMVDIYETRQDLESCFSAEKRHAILIGPGCGLNDNTRDAVFSALATEKPVVLDADAISIFQATPHSLFSAIENAGGCVLTPHAGEFRRLFGTSHPSDKVSSAREAAKRSRAIVLYKGPDTVIAAPDGRCVINNNAIPDLATAGAGDVLAGIIVALLAQGMPAFEATCAGAWMHAECSRILGPGLIAEDLCEILPEVVTGLRKETAT